MHQIRSEWQLFQPVTMVTQLTITTSLNTMIALRTQRPGVGVCSLIDKIFRVVHKQVFRILAIHTALVVDNRVSSISKVVQGSLIVAIIL